MTATANQNALNPVFSGTNTVTVLGAVARDPDVRVRPDGSKLVMVTVAGEEIITDNEGKLRKIPFYEQAMYSGKRAEKFLALGLKQKDVVLMDGKFTMRKVTREGIESNQLEIDYTVRKALGFGGEDVEFSTDASGAVRLVGGFAKATVYGRVVGKGGDLAYTQAGKPYYTFSVNARASWKNAETGAWDKADAFVRTKAWGDLAEDLAKLDVSKGMEALVEGRPRRDKYPHKDTGKPIYTLDIEPTRIVIAEGQDNGTGGGGGSRAASFDNLPSFDDMLGGTDAPPAEEESDLPF